MFVNLFVENHALCTLYPVKRNSCNEMDSVRLQAKDLRALQDYIDAQHGGPGKGWFRIVSDPFQARRVINRGKLAVIPGIEVSNLFDCGLQNGSSPCVPKDVDARLDEAYNKLGVRDMELINKFDNGFGGVAGDGGAIGLAVNSANRYETGRFWDLETCSGPTGGVRPRAGRRCRGRVAPRCGPPSARRSPAGRRRSIRRRRTATRWA